MLEGKFHSNNLKKKSSFIVIFRMEIYREVIQMLEQLFSQNVVTYAPDIPSVPGPTQRPQEGLSVLHTDTVEVVSIKLDFNSILFIFLLFIDRAINE